MQERRGRQRPRAKLASDACPEKLFRISQKLTRSSATAIEREDEGCEQKAGPDDDRLKCGIERPIPLGMSILAKATT